MTAWELPTTAEVAGQAFAIRSDYRAVLDALSALADPELTRDEQAWACIQILYPDWEHLPDYTAAFTAAMTFINLGCPVPSDQPERPRLMDWQKDATLIAPGIDHVLGYSCRRCEYLHWWEFIGAYMALGRGPFSEVVNIREKRRKGKKLEPYEREFADQHEDLISLPGKELSTEEAEFFKQLGVE